MLAVRTIEARVGAEVAARYQTWRRLRAWRGDIDVDRRLLSCTPPP